MTSVHPESMYGDSFSEKMEDDGNGLSRYFMICISIVLVAITFPVSWMVCFQVVQEYERLVIFRLGKVKKGGGQGPGLCLTLPCTDSNLLVDMRTGAHDIPSQDILTKDSVAIAVDAVVYYRVSDPMQAVCGDGDYNVTTQFKAQSVIRNILGTKTLAEILQEMEYLGVEMSERLQEGVRQNGVTIERLELKQVGIPTSMQRSMASEAKANVKSKAKFILSNAEGEASQRLVEAGDDMSPVSIHLRYLQTMLKIHRPVEEDMMYVVPLPMEIIQRITANSGIINILQKKEENNRSGKTDNVVRRRKRKV